MQDGFESRLKQKMEASFQREFERQYKLANNKEAKEELLKEAEKPKRGRKRVLSDEERKKHHALSAKRYYAKHRAEIKEYQKSYQKERQIENKRKKADKC